MIEEFLDDARKNAHQQFQSWRRANPSGFFINRDKGKTWLLHKTLCQHAGDTVWNTGIGQSLTRKKKVCAKTIQELESWVSSQQLLLRPCPDCKPVSAEGDYIAYHSSEVMGHEYGIPEQRFHFSSKKPESFLRKAIGCRVWVVASKKNGSKTIYQLAGVFTPTSIKKQKNGFGILGAGIPFREQIVVNDLPWFTELLKEQNKFSYGFNRIRSTNVVTELQRLLLQDGGESILQPDEVAMPSKFVEGATSKISVNRYERNFYARQKCIQHHGCKCSACGFNFEAVFGELGSGFIHVHHLKPLSEIGKQYEIDPIADLRPVCPNCHAMIHRTEPALTIEQLRKHMKNL